MIKAIPGNYFETEQYLTTGSGNMTAMRNVSASFLFLLLAAFSIACTPAGEKPTPDVPGSYKEILSEQAELDIPEPEIWELPNGLKVYYYFNDELPQMFATLWLPGGELYDPASKAGLASAVGSQLREGGIPGYTPDALDEALDSLAAKIETSYGDEFGKVSMYALEEDFPKVFELFSAVALRPSFNGNRLLLWKFLAGEAISRRADSPETMAAMAFVELIFGEDSAYSRYPSTQSVQSITRNDLYDFHRTFVRPNGSILAISGSVPRMEVKQQIERAFAGWSANLDPLPALPPLRPAEAPGVYLLRRPIEQATVLMGHPGPPRHSEDEFAQILYSQILGSGGFSSLLFSEIRSRLGLAYSVGGGFRTGVKRGKFSIGMQTKNSSVFDAINAVLGLVKETRSQQPAEEQFQEAKLAKLRSYVFKFSAPDAIVDRRALLKFLGYPSDFDQTFTDMFAELTKADVLRVAEDEVHPENMRILVVGNVSKDALEKEFGARFPIHEMRFDTESHIIRERAAVAIPAQGPIAETGESPSSVSAFQQNGRPDITPEWQAPGPQKKGSQ